VKHKKVFVSGCFDLLHSGHVRFLEQAAAYGDVHVGVGSDETMKELKGRYPVNSQEERKYLLEALRHVNACFVNRGSGMLDFAEDIAALRPDIFIVNNDGNTPAKQQLCEDLGIEYVVLQRLPREDLPIRTTTSLREECRIPYRIDLAGGWLDQPFVSKLNGGSVLTISIEPTVEFNERSGMASSSRKRAIELWHTELPGGDREKTAKILFTYENPPGTKEFSGSQDAIGIVFPGLNRLDYQGDYWPKKITSVQDEAILKWLEEHIYLATLGPRFSSYNVLGETNITAEGARALVTAADGCWSAIQQRDVKSFGAHFLKSFEAQVAMFPRMVDDGVRAAIKRHEKSALGWKLSGAGGGGYLILVSQWDIPGTTKIKIRRGHF
jgi:cytidyltransferase-like protein